MTAFDAPEKAQLWRFEEGGLGLSINEPGHSTFRLTSSVSLRALLEAISPDEDYLLITSFRATEIGNVDGNLRSRTLNEDCFREMPGMLRSLTDPYVHAFWLIGHWGSERRLETPSSSTTEDYFEYSWLFTSYAADATSNALLDRAILIADMFDQEAFVIRTQGETTQRSRLGEVQRYLDDDRAVVDAWAALATTRGQIYVSSDPDHGTADLNDLRPTSSYIVRGPGVPAEADFFVAQPHAISSMQIFSSLGISWRT